MALRVPMAEVSSELREGMIQHLGVVPQPAGVMANNPKVAAMALTVGGMVSGLDVVDENLQSFAHMAVAAQIGCTWCLDFGYFQAQNENLDMTKASQVPRWRESDVFTPLERDVMAYAEAMSHTPPTVTDELSARLLDRLGPSALVELTVIVAFANFSTRSNVALGIESEGYSAACEIPLAAPSNDAAVASTA